MPDEIGSDAVRRRRASHIVIGVIPVGAFDGAKSRLGAVLDAEERRDLAESLARRTIETVVATPGISETIVVTPDDDVRALATSLGARALRQRSSGLNEGIRAARDEALAAGADAILILPTDLPLVTPAAIAAILETLSSTTTPLVVIVPDRHGRGTNALLLAPPDVIDVRFGGDSCSAHMAAAAAIGLDAVRLDGPLQLDIDTADDLVLAQTSDPELVRG